MKMSIEEIHVEEVPESQQWLHSDKPSELAEVIATDYSVENRQRLADAAANAALAAVPEQYRGGPIGRNIAQAAARMALGLESLPPDESTQGEQ